VRLRGVRTSLPVVCVLLAAAMLAPASASAQVTRFPETTLGGTSLDFGASAGGSVLSWVGLQSESATGYAPRYSQDLSSINHVPFNLNAYQVACTDEWVAWLSGRTALDGAIWLQRLDGGAPFEVELPDGFSAPRTPSFLESGINSALLFVAYDGANDQILSVDLGSSGDAVASALTAGSPDKTDLFAKGACAVWLARTSSTQTQLMAYSPKSKPSLAQVAAGDYLSPTCDGSLVAWLEKTGTTYRVRARALANRDKELIATDYAADPAVRPVASATAVGWIEPTSRRTRVWSPGFGIKTGVENQCVALAASNGMVGWVGTGSAGRAHSLLTPAGETPSIVAASNWTSGLTVGSGFSAYTAWSAPGSSIRVPGFKWDRRVSGPTRYATSVEVSKATFAGSSHVVIATGENFPDALAGAPLAAALEAPILLTKRGALSPEVLEEVRRLGAKDAYILGGTAAVSIEVEQQLRGIGLNVLPRIAGTSRYATSAKIAEELAKVRGINEMSRAFVATGENYPDALAASGVAAFLGEPILLTKKTSLPLETAAALSELGIERAVVLGGVGAVTDAVKSQLPSPTRIAGSDRYDTSAKIAVWAEDNGLRRQTVLIATGANFPDALAGGVLGASVRGPLLLVKSPVPSVIDSYISHSSKDSFDGMIVVGGTAAVTEDTRKYLYATL